MGFISLEEKTAQSENRSSDGVKQILRFLPVEIGKFTGKENKTVIFFHLFIKSDILDTYIHKI